MKEVSSGPVRESNQLEGTLFSYSKPNTNILPFSIAQIPFLIFCQGSASISLQLTARHCVHIRANSKCPCQNIKHESYKSAANTVLPGLTSPLSGPIPSTSSPTYVTIVPAGTQWPNLIFLWN